MTTVRIPIDLRNPRLTSLAGNSFFTVFGFTNHDFGHWEFVKDVDGKIYGIVGIPPNVSGTPNAKCILVIAANATVGVWRNIVNYKTVAPGETVQLTYTAGASQDITVPGTAYLTKEITHTLPTGSFIGGNLIFIEIFHEGAHANDTLAPNAFLVEAYLEIDVI